MALNVLLLCGSLRSGSRCAALLDACAARAPVGVTIAKPPSLGALPLYDPDLESDCASVPAVAALRDAAAAADAFVVASPEYAHGVTGTIKNALDWLVSCPAIVGKFAAVLNPAPDAVHADASLREILRTMSIVLVDEACLRIPVIGCSLENAGRGAADPSIATRIDGMWRALVADCTRG